MPATGFVLPAARTIDAGSGTWTNDVNILADDGAEATFSLAVKNTAGRALRGQTFGFDSAVPSGATITQVEIRMEYRVNSTAGIATPTIQAFVGGAAVGAARAGSPLEPLTLTINTFDITADRAWTRADLLDGTFEVRTWGVNGNSTSDPSYRWDYIAAQVTYTTGGPVTFDAVLEAVAEHAGGVAVARALAVGLPPTDIIDAGDTSTPPVDIIDAGDTATPPTDIIDAGVLALDIVAEHAGDLTVTTAGGAVTFDAALGAVADQAGDLGVSRVLAGVAEAVAEHAGDLTVTPAAGGTVTYDAALEAVAEHAGVLDVTKAFAGASEAVADHAGELARDRGLAGASEAVAELAGILARDRQLAGAAEAVAEHAGDMSIAGQVTFAGAVEAVADHAGAIRLALTIAGASEAVSEHAGLLGVTVPIAGALAAVAEHAGALDVSGFIPPFVPGWQVTFNDPPQSVQLADPLQTVTLTGIEHTQLLADPTRTVALIDSDHNETFADNAHTVTLQGG